MGGGGGVRWWWLGGHFAFFLNGRCGNDDYL